MYAWMNPSLELMNEYAKGPSALKPQKSKPEPLGFIIQDIDIANKETGISSDLLLAISLIMTFSEMEKLHAWNSRSFPRMEKPKTATANKNNNFFMAVKS